MYLKDEDLSILKDRLFNTLKPKGYIFFRESCALFHQKIDTTYFVNYRTLNYYENLFNEKLKLIKDGSIKLYMYEIAEPFQCFWLFKKY